MRTQGAIQNIASKLTVTVVAFISSQSFAGDGGGYESDQGTRIFGTNDPKLEGVSIPFIPSQHAEYERLAIDAGHLVITRKGLPDRTVTVSTPAERLTLVGTTVPTTVGTKMNPSTQVTLVITGARQHKNIYYGTIDTVWEYNVNVTQQNGPPLCDTEGNAALVVPAAWNAGQFSAQPNSGKDTGFTFACVPILLDKSGPQFKPPSLAAFAPPKALSAVQRPLPPAAGHQDPTTGSTQKSSVVNLPTSSVVNLPASVLRPSLFFEHPLWHGGAAAKCIDHHYTPWASVAGPKKFTVTKQPMPLWNDFTARGFHNVCVQAMTADYGGDGRSHTIAGTTIALFDLGDLPVLNPNTGTPVLNPNTITPVLNPNTITPVLNPNTITPSISAESSFRNLTLGESLNRQYDNLTFEGVWTEEVNEKDKTRYARALCLAKARWQTIDPSEDSLKMFQGSDRKLHPCEDLTLEELYKAGKDTPLLISYSATNDRGLYWFPNSTGGITTTRVQLTAGCFEIDRALLPCTEPCTKPCTGIYLGNILSPDAPHGGFDTVPLYLYTDGKAGYATVTLPTMKAYIDSRFWTAAKEPEGYLFSIKTQLSSLLPDGADVQAPKLQLWRLAPKNDEGRYCTITESHVCNTGFTMDTPQLGYLLVPGLNLRDLASTIAPRESAVGLPNVPKPGPVENLGEKGAIQARPVAGQAPITTQQAPAATQKTRQ